MSAEAADESAPPAASASAPRRSARDLTSGSIFAHLMRFVLPMSFGITASMLVGLIDAFWLGRLSTDALAAASFAFPVSFVVFSISIGLGSGAVAAVSRVVGTGDQSRVQRLATDAMILAVLVVAAVSTIGSLVTRPLFAALGAEGVILDYVVQFMTIWFVGVVFVVAPMIGSSIMRALGDAVLPSLLMMLAAAVNLVLDPLLIFGVGPFPRMEVAGAALATVIANGVSAILVLSVMIFRERIITFARVPFSVLLRHWGEVGRVGFFAAVSAGINPLALTIVVSSLARFGGEAVGGYGAASRVEAFAVIPMFALSAAIGPVTGQNAGAGRLDRVRLAFLRAFQFAVVWGLVMAAVLAVAAPYVALLFSDDPAAQAATREYLRITPVTVWGYGVVMGAAAGFNGLSRPLHGVAMTVTRSLVLMAGGAWIGGTLGGVPGTFVGIAAANVAGGLIAAGWTLLNEYPSARAKA